MRLLAVAVLTLMLAGCGEDAPADRYSDREKPDHDFFVVSDNDSVDGTHRSVDINVNEGANHEAIEPIADYVFFDGYENTTVRFYAEVNGDYYQYAKATYSPSLDISFQNYKPVSTGNISRDQYGSSWPFTIDSGELDCRPGPAALFIANERAYQLNGVARQMGYQPIDSIWRDNPAIPGAKVSLSPIIQDALALCN